MHRAPRTADASTSSCKRFDEIIASSDYTRLAGRWSAATAARQRFAGTGRVKSVIITYPRDARQVSVLIGVYTLDIRFEVLRILDDAMGLKGRATKLGDADPLLGSVPELDSMAVVTIIGMLEDRLGITVEDDEIDGQTFATVGSLVKYVSDKVQV
jgi:acyl carrier protein